MGKVGVCGKIIGGKVQGETDYVFRRMKTAGESARLFCIEKSKVCT